MEISAITKAGGTLLGRSILQLKKYAPEILTTVGVVGVVTAGVLASKATLSLEHVVDDNANRVKWTKESIENGDDQPRALTGAYIRNVGNIVKLYGPSVTLGAASIACIIGAHGIMRKRNVALVAAYKTLETAYSAYRERVVEAIGEDKERDIYLGLREETIEDDKGKKTKVKVLGDPTVHSPYARFFDEHNVNWESNSEYNLFFLRAQQSYWTDMLRARGHVFLNEVYDSIGLEHSSAGAVVGWILSEEGDGYVDFGIYEARNRDFVNGNERSILLDFNVDGTIFDKI